MKRFPIVIEMTHAVMKYLKTGSVIISFPLLPRHACTAPYGRFLYDPILPCPTHTVPYEACCYASVLPIQSITGFYDPLTAVPILPSLALPYHACPLPASPLRYCRADLIRVDPGRATTAKPLSYVSLSAFTGLPVQSATVRKRAITCLYITAKPIHANTRPAFPLHYCLEFGSGRIRTFMTFRSPD
jgi:hypothetical protein